MVNYKPEKWVMNITIKRSVPLLVAVMTLLAILALCLGPTLYNPLSIQQTFQDPFEVRILTQLRLPRVVFALIVGFALTLAGVGAQGIFRNPLADPYVLGISSGASVGAAVAISFSNDNPFIMTVVFGFIGAMSVSAFLLVLVKKQSWSIHHVLLIGIAINLFCGSILALIMFASHEQTSQIVLWLMGNLGQSNWNQMMMIFVMVVVGATILLPQAPYLDLHLFGEETAFALGAESDRYKTRTILAMCILVTAAVSFCGAIGFVGLIIPHAIRLLLGPNHIKLMCIAPLVGASFLLVCDTIARTILLPQELPVGVITGVVGGPIFIYLLFREQQS